MLLPPLKNKFTLLLPSKNFVFCPRFKITILPRLNLVLPIVFPLTAKLQFCPQFPYNNDLAICSKLCFPPFKNKFTLLLPVKNFNFALGSNLRFCPV
ncbi:hypothetical protein Hanom_Chr17g01579361 [Helianthus anomalus]